MLLKITRTSKRKYYREVPQNYVDKVDSYNRTTWSILCMYLVIFFIWDANIYTSVQSSILIHSGRFKTMTVWSMLILLTSIFKLLLQSCFLALLNGPILGQRPVQVLYLPCKFSLFSFVPLLTNSLSVCFKWC